MAFIGSWPGPIHEGHGKASYYIDHRADDRQFDALSKIITGEAGSGGQFALYASIKKNMTNLKERVSDLKQRVSGVM